MLSEPMPEAGWTVQRAARHRVGARAGGHQRRRCPADARARDAGRRDRAAAARTAGGTHGDAARRRARSSSTASRSAPPISRWSTASSKPKSPSAGRPNSNCGRRSPTSSRRASSRHSARCRRRCRTSSTSRWPRSRPMPTTPLILIDRKRIDEARDNVSRISSARRPHGLDQPASAQLRPQAEPASSARWRWPKWCATRWKSSPAG